jgi:hypothetical protein
MGSIVNSGLARDGAPMLVRKAIQQKSAFPVFTKIYLN